LIRRLGLRNPDLMDDDIRRDIAFALAKHIRSNRTGDATTNVAFWPTAEVARWLVRPRGKLVGANLNRNRASGIG